MILTIANISYSGIGKGENCKVIDSLETETDFEEMPLPPDPPTAEEEEDDGLL